MFELSWYCRDMGNSRQPFSARLVRNEPDIGRCSLTPRPLSTIRLRGCGSRHLDRPWPGASRRTVRLPVVKTELVVPPERVSARRRRHGSSARSPWWSTSPPLTRAPFVRARARSRPTWRARSIRRAGTDERRSVPRRHGDAQGVALAVAATAAAKLPLEVEQPGVRRPAVLQQLGVDVGPLSAGRHRSRRPRARHADRRAGRHSAAGCSSYVPLRQSSSRAGPLSKGLRVLRFSS